MKLKNLWCKTVFELDRQNFIQLFCDYCRFNEICIKSDRNLQNCKCFVNEGLYNQFFKKK